MTDLAYHFTGPTLRDGSPLPAIGEWEIYDGPVLMCESGLHASRDPFDAFQYAPGSNLRLVEIERIEAEQDDKLVCRRRRTIQQIDATILLREFTRWCALQVIHLWDAPQVVRDYLVTGDEALRATAQDAAWAAARAAARAAAWAAARAAAQDAARAAAWATAQDAAVAVQRTKFKELVDAAFANS